MSNGKSSDCQKSKSNRINNYPGRKYYPRCSCGTVKQQGVCPHGCDAFCRPSRTVRLAEKGREAPKESGTYLTPKEVDDGAIRFLSKSRITKCLARS